MYEAAFLALEKDRTRRLRKWVAKTGSVHQNHRTATPGESLPLLGQT